MLNTILIIIIIIIIYLLIFPNTYPVELTDIKIRNKIKELLSLTNKVFTENNLPYWIISGTLLGSVRHKDIIPWDDDADIGILDEAKLLTLVNELKKLGLGFTEFKYGYKIFELTGQDVYIGDSLQTWKYPFVDIFIYEKKDNQYILKNINARTVWSNDYFMENELFPFKLVPFGNLTLPSPNIQTNYLDRLYGSDWSTVAYKGYDHEYERGRESKKFNLF